MSRTVTGEENCCFEEESKVEVYGDDNKVAGERAATAKKQISLEMEEVKDEGKAKEHQNDCQSRSDMAIVRRMLSIVAFVVTFAFLINVTTLVVTLTLMIPQQNLPPSSNGYRDTSTQDVDECTPLNSPCHAYAICQNTTESFTCFCKTGYSGDGLKCVDIDECVSGVHDCHSSSSCINNEGSYSCSCNYPYIGNGTTCVHPVAECQNYQSLNSADRKITYAGITNLCDSTIGPGWFRFQGAAGNRMPTSCPPINRCGTAATGWFNGIHPTVAQGQVIGQVCFHWDSKCCYLRKNIKVRNCGSYYVYYLINTWCHYRYCSTD